ncbi:hypothetical protein Q7C36_001990 [Tachysurus vachellii]|uniref:Uncharacterized protein n=1 Tax=Tachysurus vachellii TaxID=175792 RepID=A0AA88NXF6_TACVA|nr:hypothetical protein Q7C36_001990 [Tachysurus vachellii]
MEPEPRLQADNYIKAAIGLFSSPYGRIRCGAEWKFILQIWETKAGVLLQLGLALRARFDTSCLAQKLSAQHRAEGLMISRLSLDHRPQDALSSNQGLLHHGRCEWLSAINCV